MFKFFKRFKIKKYATSTLMHMKLDDEEVKYCHTIHYVEAPDEIEAKKIAVDLATQMQPEFEISNVIALDITDKV